MKKRLLSSFIVASLMMGCDQHDPATNNEQVSSEVKNH